MSPSGTIITDNLKFHGLVDKDEEEIESRNLRALVRKIKEYISFLKGNINYKIPEGYWIINLDNKRLIIASEKRMHEELSQYDISNRSNG